MAESSTVRTRTKTCTVMFTDVAGSTSLRSRYGDEHTDQILRAHEAIVRRALATHGGREIQLLGDGFLATFRSPQAAVDCAVDIQRAVSERNRAEQEPDVRVRIGLHHGPVTERDGNVYGQTVHAAARVAGEAAADQILVSGAVREALATSDHTRLADRGLFWLKGFTQRWRLYEAAWQSEPSERPRMATTLTPFVGRDEERAELRRVLDAARAGEGCVVLVSGEAGVGKSRLVREVSLEAETHGVCVLVGHCVEMDSSAPYLPFVEILEQALVAPRSPLAFRDALGEEAAEIARIVPALRQVIADLPDPVDLPPEQGRRYLWNSILAWLDRVTRQHPALLVLEDLHWADKWTLLLLEYLAGHLATLPLLVVGTYRDVEVGVTHQLARIANQLVRRRLATRVALTRLTAEGVVGMLRGLADAEPPDALVRAINTETEGNPFFVEEVFLHLSETGRLFDEQGRFREDLRIDVLDVPESIRLVVGERLGRLSSATREALLSAAVVGRVFDAEIVEHVAGLGPEAFVEALDEAEQARLVTPAKTDGRLMFSHELIRQTLLADASSVRRQVLHERTADALEGIHADNLEAYAGEVAYHLSRSGPRADNQRLAHHLIVAGMRDIRAAAFESAVTNLEQALRLIPVDDPERRAGVLERLAIARRSVGEWDTALEAMDEALDIYGELGRTDKVGRLCSIMVYQLAWATRYEEAMAVSTRGLAALEELVNPDRARLLAATGWVTGLAGDYTTATGMFDQARLVIEQLDDERAAADVLHMETLHRFSYAELDRGVEVGLRAGEVYDAQGALWDLCSVLSFVMYQAGTQARRGLADRLAERVAELADRFGHLGAAFLELADRSRKAVMAGDTATLESLAPREIDLCERGGLPWLYLGYLYLGFAARWRGDVQEGERQLRRAVALEPPSAFAGQSVAHLAVHLAYEGRADEVYALFEGRRENLPIPGQINSLGIWNTLFGFTEALYVAGYMDAAADTYPLILEALEHGGDWVTIDCRFTTTRAGIAATAARRWDEAEQHYRAALAAAEVVDHRVERADVRRFHAWMLQDRDRPGDADRARQLLGLAAEEYRELGLSEPRLPRRDGGGAALYAGRVR